MRCNVYTCLTFYGYEIEVPKNISYKKFVDKLLLPSARLRMPFTITGLLPEVLGKMEFLSKDDLLWFDDDVNVLIGFTPDDDLNKTLELANELSKIITDNRIVEGLKISKTPKFYSGVEWFDRYIGSDNEDDDDEEDDEEEE